MWCETSQLGERIPVVLASDADRNEALKANGLQRSKDAWVMVSCQRPLPPGGKLGLVWGPGIASSVDSTVTTRGEQRLNFSIRSPLTAEFSCERERANAPCIPIRPIRVEFSEPVPKDLAMAVRLRGPDNKLYSPTEEKSAVDEGDSANRRRVSFPFPLPESAPSSWSCQGPEGHQRSSAVECGELSDDDPDQPGAAARQVCCCAVWHRRMDPREPSLVPLTMRHVQPSCTPGGLARC